MRALRVACVLTLAVAQLMSLFVLHVALSPHSCAVKLLQRLACMLTLVIRIVLQLSLFCVQLVWLCSLPTAQLWCCLGSARVARMLTLAHTLMCCFEFLATNMFTLVLCIIVQLSVFYV